MSQNNSTILYAGLDVAKASLQFHLRGVGYQLENTKKDHARILRLLAQAEAAAPAGTRIQVVLEATEELSWKMTMRTVLPSPTCGLMRSVMPTSLRSMVV